MLTSPGHSFLNSLLTVHRLSYSLHGSVRYSFIFSSPSGLLYNLGKITSRPCATDLPSICQMGLVSNPPLAKSVETMNSGVGQLRTSMCSQRVIYNINSFLCELSSQTSSLTFYHVFALVTLQQTHRTICLKLDSPTTFLPVLLPRENGC